MTNLPAGWTLATVADLAEVIAGQAPPGRSYNTAGIGLPLFQGKTDFGSLRLQAPRQWTTEPSKVAERDDVLVSVRAPVGPTNLATTRCAIGRGLAAIRCAPGVNQKYLLYYLRSSVQQLEERATGTTFSAITRGVLCSHPVRVCPSAEQERIVAAIEEQFSRLDAGAAALKRARVNLKRMRAALLQAAITGQLLPQDPSEGSGHELLLEMLEARPHSKRPSSVDDSSLAVPASWAIGTLEAATDPERVICYGILMPRVKEGGVVPYVEVKDLRASRLSPANLHRTSQELHEAFPRSVLGARDVVLAIRGSYDRALVVPDDVVGANVSRDVARIAPLAGLEPNFLVAYLTSPAALGYLRTRARGVAVKGVNIADLRSMPMPLPPFAEQRRIVEELQRVGSILDQVEGILGAAESQERGLRSSILATAFSAKLAAQDAADEPASVLLERIAAERTPASDKAKGAMSKQKKSSKVIAA